MSQSESIANIVTAIAKSALEMQNVEKNMTVGSGNNSYKGVADKDIKAMTRAMLKNGLVMLPVDYKTDMKYETWDEAGNYGTKKKRDVFVELTATYRLCHSSGEFIEVLGYGHATDTNDKAAGKATTYALKYAQMYVFNLIIGTIDDTDLFHSEDTPTETKAVPKATPPKPTTKTSTITKTTTEDKPKKFVKGVKEDAPAPEPQSEPPTQEDLLAEMFNFKTRQEVMAWYSTQIQEGDDEMKAVLRERKSEMLAYTKTL